VSRTHSGRAQQATQTFEMNKYVTHLCVLYCETECSTYFFYIQILHVECERWNKSL